MKPFPTFIYSFLACLAFTAIAAGQSLANGKWTIERVDGKTVKITGPDGASANFAMDYRVFLSTKNPKPAKTRAGGVNYAGGT